LTEPSTRSSFAIATLVAAASFLAALPAVRAFDVTFAAGIVLLAASLSTAITFVVARGLRQPAVVSYLCSLLALVLFLLVVCGPHPDAIARDLVQGPNRVLSEIAPLSGSPSVMAVLIVLTWLCGAATSEVLIRSRRPAAGLAIPVGLFVVALAATESAPGRYDAVGPVLLAVLAALALVRHYYATPVIAVADTEDSSTPPRYRAPAVGAMCVAVVATSLALVVPALPSMSRPPSSLHRTAPTSLEAVTDPLGAMAGLRGQPSVTNELAVQLDQPASGYLGVAELDKYDGGNWSFDTTFHPTGGRVPRSSSATGFSAPPVVHQRVTIDTQLPVPLLPTLDRPAQVHGASVVTDNGTGMLLPESNSKLPLPFTYSVSSSAPVSTLNRLPKADGFDMVDPDSADLQVPANSALDLAAAFRYFATITNNQQPKATVAYLQSWLAAIQTSDRRIDPTLSSKPKAQRSGHPTTTATTVPAGRQAAGVSLSEVIKAVTINHAAMPEQFATMFAMVSRYLGVPARVVTGFRLAESATSGPVAAGRYTVDNLQAWAWVEVPVSGMGWVVADPTPELTIAPNKIFTQNVQAAPTTSVPPRPANAVAQNGAAGGHALAKPAAPKASASNTASLWLVILIAVLAFALLLLIAGPGQAAWRRARRRRSRRSDRPDELAVGAWLELLDDLERAGMEPTDGWTSTEVADEVGLHFGSEHQPPVRAVGALADQAVFSTAPDFDLETAEKAWQTQEEATRGVMRSLDRRQRIRALLSVGRGPRLPY
jgi:hypothetical protein